MRQSQNIGFTIDYAVEKNLSAKEFRQVLIGSTLGEQRPVDDEALTKILENGNLIVTARRNKQAYRSSKVYK
jgi:hypothetical protein